MLVVFDLDGVIIDSRDVITRAYQRVGVTPPGDVLALEGKNWIMQVTSTNPEYIKRRKNKYYLEALEDGEAPLLSAHAAACQLWPKFTTALITGAPRGTVEALRSGLDLQLWPFDFWIEEMRTLERMELLRRLDPAGVYVDDQSRLVHLPPGWSFIKYDRQSTAEIVEEVTKVAALRGGGVTPDR